MKGICPNCERVVGLEIVQQQEKLNVRGDAITIDVNFLKCAVCSTEFNDPMSIDDPLENAYRKYRDKHGLVQPEEIRAFRKKYGLTQQELSSLLGWGGATLSRYENGALQDDAHNTTLALVMEPINLLDLIEKKPDVLGLKKRNSLIKTLQSKGSFLSFCNSIIGSYEASDDSGNKKLDLNKLLNTIIFFCKEASVPKTKLNKLLFYADFRHYKEYDVSITGAKYARLPYGPVLDQYEHYFAFLYHDEHALTIKEKDFGDYVGEYFRSVKEPDLSLFSASELKVLSIVKENFASHTASQIKEKSHKEQGYKETSNSQIISYQYAEFLSI